MKKHVLRMGWCMIEGKHACEQKDPPPFPTWLLPRSAPPSANPNARATVSATSCSQPSGGSGGRIPFSHHNGLFGVGAGLPVDREVKHQRPRDSEIIPTTALAMLCYARNDLSNALQV